MITVCSVVDDDELSGLVCVISMWYGLQVYSYTTDNQMGFARHQKSFYEFQSNMKLMFCHPKFVVLKPSNYREPLVEKF